MSDSAALSCDRCDADSALIPSITDEIGDISGSTSCTTGIKATVTCLSCSAKGICLLLILFQVLHEQHRPTSLKELLPYHLHESAPESPACLMPRHQSQQLALT